MEPRRGGADLRAVFQLAVTELADPRLPPSATPRFAEKLSRALAMAQTMSMDVDSCTAQWGPGEALHDAPSSPETHRREASPLAVVSLADLWRPAIESAVSGALGRAGFEVRTVQAAVPAATAQGAHGNVAVRLADTRGGDPFRRWVDTANLAPDLTRNLHGKAPINLVVRMQSAPGRVNDR